jgi:hypothetical protein
MGFYPRKMEGRRNSIHLYILLHAEFVVIFFVEVQYESDPSFLFNFQLKLHIELDNMSSGSISSLIELPVLLIHRIFDNLKHSDIFWCATGVCQRMNDIIAVYQPYKVK